MNTEKCADPVVHDRHTGVMHHASAPLWVVFGLAMGPAVALGFGRFAYALLLPAMRPELGWSFADAGAMNTANAVGYLAGAWLAAPMGKKFGDKRVFAAGLLATALAVGAVGLTAHFMTLLALRLAAGFSGAVAFVAGAGLTSAAAAGGSKNRAPIWLGIYFSGAGMGVAVSALALAPLLDSIGWRGAWLALGALSLLATGSGALALRRAPAAARPPAHGAPTWSPRFMARTLCAYTLYGAGYIAYATFIIAFLRDGQGLNSGQISVFWSIVGFASVAAAFLWGPVIGRLPGGAGTACIIALVAIGAAVPLLWSGPAAAYLSALLFGGSFLAVIASVTAFARKATPQRDWTAAIAALTVAFGIGQCVGPVLSGMVSDGASGMRAGLWLSVVMLRAAAVVAASQGEPPRS